MEEGNKRVQLIPNAVCPLYCNIEYDAFGHLDMYGYK